MQKYDITYKVSTTYHPQSNAQAELTNEEIREIFRKDQVYLFLLVLMHVISKSEDNV